jgi:hypothetical protein
MAEIIVRVVGALGSTLEVLQAVGANKLSVRMVRGRDQLIIETFSQENIVEFAHLIIKQWGSKT